MEKKNCHECGLEDADACEQGRHIPALESFEPCRSCIRNPRIADRFDERWILNEDGNATQLLRNKGGEQYGRKRR